MRPIVVGGLLAVLLSAPAAAAPDKTRPAPPDDAADIAARLLERTDFDRYEQIGLRSMIEILQEKLGYTILVDHNAVLAALGEDGATRQALEERVVTVPDMKRVRLETVLREVLDQVHADFYVEADHVKVTSAMAKDFQVGPHRTLPDLRPTGEELTGSEVGLVTQVPHRPTVTAAFKDIPLAEAIKAVSQRTGRAVAINPDADAKAKVSVALSNAPFETAVGVLAEAAGLRAFRIGHAAVIVTPERARQIEGLANGCPVPESQPGPSDQANQIRKDLSRADDERKALEEKVRKLTEELEKLKKK
jgi:hypothetical protein